MKKKSLLFFVLIFFYYLFSYWLLILLYRFIVFSMLFFVFVYSSMYVRTEIVDVLMTRNSSRSIPKLLNNLNGFSVYIKWDSRICTELKILLFVTIRFFKNSVFDLFFNSWIYFTCSLLFWLPCLQLNNN